MRSHGVPSFPDPNSTNFALIPAGFDPTAPAFKTAASTCDHLVPQLHPPQQASEHASEQLLKFSTCVRSHGLAAFPDPTPTRPANRSGASAMIRRGGAYLAIPARLISSPAYKQATSACGSLLAG